MGDELQALVAGVLEDLDGAGALADALQEAGREREAVLLRRRWKAWKTERRMALESMRGYADSVANPMREAVATLRTAGFEVEASIHVQPADLTPEVDGRFRRYIRERFAAAFTVLTVKRWGHHYGISHVVGYERDGALLRSLCDGPLFFASEVTTVFGTRICRKCRARLPDLKPATGE